METSPSGKSSLALLHGVDASLFAADLCRVSTAISWLSFSLSALYTDHAQGLATSELEAAGVRKVLAKAVDPGALEAALTAVSPIGDRAG